MKFKPGRERILVKRDEFQNKTKYGLYVPLTANEKSNSGIVIAVGNDVDEDFKVNSLVLFNKASGFNLEIDGNVYLMLHNREIIGVYI